MVHPFLFVCEGLRVFLVLRESGVARICFGLIQQFFLHFKPALGSPNLDLFRGKTILVTGKATAL